MLAYALTIAFVSTFIAIAVTGHVLLLMALYPNLFGKLAASAKNDSAQAQLRQPEPAPPQAPKMAA